MGWGLKKWVKNNILFQPGLGAHWLDPLSLSINLAYANLFNLIRY